MNISTVGISRGSGLLLVAVKSTERTVTAGTIMGQDVNSSLLLPALIPADCKALQLPFVRERTAQTLLGFGATPGASKRSRTNGSSTSVAVQLYTSVDGGWAAAQAMAKAAGAQVTSVDLSSMETVSAIPGTDGTDINLI